MEPWAHRFFELSSELFLVLGPGGRILEANPAWGELVGSSPEDLKARGCRAFVHPADLGTLEARLDALSGRGGRASLSCRWRCEDGTWQWLSWSVASAPGDARLYCTVRLLETPSLEGAQKPEPRAPEGPAPKGPPMEPLWSLSDHLPFGLYLVERATGRVVYANRRFCQLWGIELLERAIRRGEVSHAEVLQHCRNAGTAAEFLHLPEAPAEAGPSGLHEDEAMLRDGRTLRRLATSLGVMGDAGRYRLFAFEDVTERKRTELALKRSEQDFRKLIESAPEGIFVHRDQRFLYVNPTLLRALGYAYASELIGQPIWSIVHPDDLELVRQRVDAVAVRGELAPLREIRYLRKDGSWYDAESAGLPVEFDGSGAVVVMSRDITERKRLQLQLLQTDRMVLAGTLAAGVGHEINNPLTYVMANIGSAMELLARLRGELSRATPEPRGVEAWATPVQEAETLLEESLEGATRVRNIVRELKFISRQEEERRELVDVRQPLDFSLKMASRELRHRARIIKKYEPVAAVHVDASRLGQVFLNLLVNAAQAIPEGHVEDNHVTVWVRPTEAGGVAVDVSDSGNGISPAVMARIFDPFFTTKPVGSGTGLGLSICHGIIRNLGGDITVRSEVGRGTTFTVLLPPAPDVVTAPPAVPAPPPRAERQGRVLIIDDEPAIGRALARIIGPRHKVTLVCSGEEALATLASSQPFDAVFCDLMMPGVTGMDVYERLRESGPDLLSRFIFITGGSYTSRASQFLERVPNPRIDKPFDVQSLRELLGAVMAAT